METKREINVFFFVFCRLGLATREQCEMALQRTNWNVELAASSILDR